MSAIHSQALMTLVMTRAHVLAVMADDRLGPLAKQVGCLLWAITETWERGETKRVPWSQVAENITYPGGKHPSERGIRSAVAELEAAGYLVVDRSNCHRGNPARTTMVRREVGDPLLDAPAGSDWRAWTKTMEQKKAPSQKGASQKGASQKPPSESTPKARKGVPEEPPYPERGYLTDPLSGQKGVSEEPPIKETFFNKGTQEDPKVTSKQTLPPLRASGDASGPGLISSGWDELVEPQSVLGLLMDNLTDDGRQEMDRRKQTETLSGITDLMETFSVPEVVVGLGYWVGDRRLAQADKLAQVVTQRLKRLTYDPDDLRAQDPDALLREGFEHGHASLLSRSEA